MSRVREPFVWREEFATGVEEIDEQHMILVETLNEARTLLAGGDDAEAIDEITRDLLSYALYHFETEERLMSELGYEQSDALASATHLAEHRGFSARVVTMRNGIRAGDTPGHDELLTFLEQWLIDHIQKTDRKLAGFILKQRRRPH